MAHDLDLMRPYEEDGWPLALRLFQLAEPGNELQVAFLIDHVRKQPEICKAVTANNAEGTDTNIVTLNLAIRSGSADLVELVLAAGGQPELRFLKSASPFADYEDYDENDKFWRTQCGAIYV